jgi:hypothetical protein
LEGHGQRQCVFAGRIGQFAAQFGEQTLQNGSGCGVGRQFAQRHFADERRFDLFEQARTRAGRTPFERGVPGGKSAVEIRTVIEVNPKIAKLPRYFFWVRRWKIRASSQSKEADVCTYIKNSAIT